MARNITEAKQYLENEVKRLLNEAGLGHLPYEVLFAPIGSTVAISTVFYKKGVQFQSGRIAGEPAGIQIKINIDSVRSNIHNIENPYFKDLIAHEVSHAADEIRHKKSHGHRKPFRDIYKSLATSTAVIGMTTPPDIVKVRHYYGGKGYGPAPRSMVRAKLTMCQACRRLELNPDTAKRCDVCGGDLIHLRDVSPREILQYNMKLERVEDQEYLHGRYGDSIPKSQKARRKKTTILDRAMRVVGGRYG